jgi:hypothetical protein
MLRGGIDSTDQAIDSLVHQLYGLPPEEIIMVERKKYPSMRVGQVSQPPTLFYQ